MKRKFINALLFCGLVAGTAVTLASCEDYDDDIDSLQAQIDANEASIEDLAESQVVEITSNISSLESAQSSLETSIETTKTELEAAIESATDDIEANDADITELQNELATLETSLALVEEAITALNTALEDYATTDDLLAAQNELSTAITEAKTLAEAAQEAAEGAQSLADTNSEAIDAIVSILSGSVESLDASQYSLLGDDLLAALEQIASNKAYVDGQLATVTSLAESNSLLIDSLQAVTTDSLESLAAQIATLDALVASNLTAAESYTDAQIELLRASLDADSIRLDEALAEIATTYATASDLTDLTARVAALEGVDWADSIQSSISSLMESVATMTWVEEQGYITKDALTDYITDDDLTATLSSYATTEDLEAYLTLEDLQNLADALLDSYLADYASQADLDDLSSTVSTLSATVTNNDTLLAERISALEDALESDSSSDDDSEFSLDDISTIISAYMSSEDNAVSTAISTAISTLSGGYEGTLSDLNTAIENNATEVSEDIATLQNQIDLILGLGAYLKSLVFSPELYYQGIEAIGVYSYNYNAVTVADADITIDQSTEVPTYAADETSVAPGVVASYYLNPSNAVIDFDVENYVYIVNNATYTRSLDSTDITITNVDYGTYTDGSINTGKIDVTFNVDATELSQITDDETSYVDVIALQYTYKGEEGNDTTITSDFAALKQYVITDFAINKADVEGETDELNESDKDSHLATTAPDAVERDDNNEYAIPYFTLAYTDTLDLDEWINVHYNADSVECSLFGDQEMIAKQNFELDYELIGYVWTNDNNDTGTVNESSYGSIDGSLFTAVGPQAIGHSPLIRVKLVDHNADDQIAAVGYIVVVITDNDAPLIVEADPVEAGYYLACNDTEDDAFFGGVLAASQLEKDVLEDLGLLISEFEGIYAIVTNSEGAVLQYTKDEASDTAFTVTADSIGTIAYIAYSEVGGPAENVAEGLDSVLSWTISYEAANKALATAEKDEDGDYLVSTWVKFEPVDTVVDRRNIYVKVTWKAEANMSPTVTVTAENKIQSEWYALDSREKGEYELQLQVGGSTDQNSTTGCVYEQLDIEGTFLDSLTNVFKQQLIEEGYTSLANSIKAKYVFAPTEKQYHTAYNNGVIVGESDTTYTIKAVTDTIYAVNTINDSIGIVATIDTVNGAITIDTESTYAKDIINGVDTRDDLADMLTLTVYADVDVCAEAYSYFTVVNKRIEVKVITPIFVGEASEITLQLNKGTYMTARVDGLDLTDFNGYDDADFYEYSDENETFYEFYGIESIIQDTTNVVLTSYGQGGLYKDTQASDWTEVREDWFEITYVGLDPVDDYVSNGTVADYGTVTITQLSNTSRSSDFQILIPIVVTYQWGDLHGNILVNVQMAQ